MSDLLDMPEGELAAFFQGIGAIVVVWGTIEHNFDVHVDALYQIGGKTLVKRQPTGIKQRAKFAKTCIKQAHLYRNHRERGTQYIDDVLELAQARHNFIHSAISEYSEENGIISGVRLVNRGHSLEPVETTFIPEDYPTLMKRMLKVRREGQNLLLELAEESRK